MQTWTRSVITLLIVLWASVSFAERDYVLTITEVSVKATRANGKSWDLGIGESKQPDLYASVAVNGSYVLQESFEKNRVTVSPQAQSESFDLTQATLVNVVIYDKDMNKDDLIGSLHFTLSPDDVGQSVSYGEGLIKSVKLKLSLTRAGREARKRRRAEARAAAEAKAKLKAEQKAARLKEKLREVQVAETELRAEIVRAQAETSQAQAKTATRATEAQVEVKQVIVSPPALSDEVPEAQPEAQRDLYEMIPAETSYALRVKGSAHAPSMISSGMNLKFIRDLLKHAPSPRDHIERFVRESLLDFVALHQNQRLESIGVDLNTTQVAIYGFGLWPVASIQLADPALFKKWIQKRFAKAGVGLKPWGQASEVYDLECDSQDEFVCLLTFTDHRVSATVTLKTFASQLIDHLKGVQPVKTSLKESRFVEALAKHAEAGTHTSGFFSVERIIKTLLGQGEGLNASLLPALLDLSSRLSKVCITEYLSIVKMMPDIYLGQKDVQPNEPTIGKVLWRFNGALAQASGTFSARDLYRVEDGRALMSIGLAMDIPAILQSVHTLTGHLMQTPYQCPHLSQGLLAPENIQQGRAMTQLLPSFVRNIRGISFSLLGVTLDEQQPTQVNALAILTSDEAPMLLQFLKSVAPLFRDLVVPQVGGPAEPLEGAAVPSLLRGLKWKVTQDTIGVAFGERAVKVLEESVKTPRAGAVPLLSFQYRVNDLLALLRQGLKVFAPHIDQEVVGINSPFDFLDINIGFSSKGLYATSTGYFTK